LTEARPAQLRQLKSQVLDQRLLLAQLDVLRSARTVLLDHEVLERLRVVR
jgi:hypothetical protein